VLGSRMRSQKLQQSFDFDDLPSVQRLDVVWADMAERAKRNRTVFAQNRIKPEDVLPEWARMQAALGNEDDVQRFAHRALRRLGAGLELRGKDASRGWRAPLAGLPEDLRERLLAEGLHGTVGLSFTVPPPAGTRFVHRSHPLISTLAEGLLERTLTDAGLDADPTYNDAANLGRTGCWVSPAVNVHTTILLLRLRHQLSSADARGGDTLLVEEAAAVALCSADGGQRFEITVGDEPLSWLTEPPAETLDDRAREERVMSALREWAKWQPTLETFARERADALLADHRRVREAADSRGRYKVIPLLPVDVIGVFVLLPPLDI